MNTKGTYPRYAKLLEKYKKRFKATEIFKILKPLTECVVCDKVVDTKNYPQPIKTIHTGDN